jgi:hypothetical protein
VITLSMISLLVGVALGQRFKINVLIPACAILVILAVGAGLAHARSAWYIVLIVATAATSLQIGYFISIGVLRHLLAAARSRKTAPLTSPRTPARHAAH